MRPAGVPAEPPHDVGTTVHGPLLLTRGPGISAELHHVQAHATGLMLHLVLRASGIHAEAAKRQLTPRRQAPLAPDDREADAGSQPVLHIEVNGTTHRLPPQLSNAHGDDDSLEMDAQLWIDERPSDGRVAVSAEWPRAGLPLDGAVLDISAGLQH
ncbi:hypothetical protein [Kineococcus sp. SYSU DK006]|uniref:hypothetical protein n=1 Tax=Kineococcus sp. SYSU DK006 TaxID=3383127 RepID=UPI003D7CC1A9